MERAHEEPTRHIRPIMESQLFGVLATRDTSGLHTSLVAFAGTEDLTAVFFATPVQSRKFRNLSRYASVSLFVDNRINDPGRIDDITGISIKGDAESLDERERHEALRVYTQKHPYIHSFAQHPDTALVRIRAREYQVVTRFSHVSIYSVA